MQYFVIIYKAMQSAGDPYYNKTRYMNIHFYEIHILLPIVSMQTFFEFMKIKTNAQCRAETVRWLVQQLCKQILFPTSSLCSTVLCLLSKTNIHSIAFRFV